MRKTLFILVAMVLLTVTLAYTQSFEITTNQLDPKQVQELVSTGKLIISDTKLKGMKALTPMDWIYRIGFILYAIYKLAQIIGYFIVKATKSKEDDAKYEKIVNKANTIVGGVFKGIMTAVFGKIK